MNPGKLRYGAILADPPWSFKTRSEAGEGRSAKNHYSTMSLEEIKALPVSSVAAPDSCLFLWAIDPMIPQALDVMKAWGFEFKTIGFYWVKQNKGGAGFFTGMGFWTRANPEQVLLGTRGRPKRKAMDVRRLLIAPRREHSRKPSAIHTRIEDLVAGPYLELFARERMTGWDAIGDEVGRFS